MSPSNPIDPLDTTPAQRDEFVRLFGGGRMKSYDGAAAQSAVPLDSVELYSYNMALAAAYLGPIHILEVVARNAIHAQLAAHTRREDWWDSPKIHLVERQQNALTEAELKVDKQLNSSRARTADDVVAALDFGFWCGLLGRGDAQGGAPYEREIWQPAVRFAFPNHRSNRGDLWQQFNATRTFRNRITHHEPIHTVDLEKMATSVTRLISAVSPPMAAWVAKRSRLGYVAKNPPGSSTPLRTF
ncbi:hypothetical protein [Mycetocola saprophilus]|uniref:hypothetical protein n=1 Tax=Mycetocola saprophilus TaxID=76636 RepID=UPI003BF04EFD